MNGHGDHDEQLAALLTVLGELGDAAAALRGPAAVDRDLTTRLVACQLDLQVLVAALVRRSGRVPGGAGPCVVGPVGGDDDGVARAVAASHPHPERLVDRLVDAVDTAALLAVSTGPGAVRLGGRLVCTADLAGSWAEHLETRVRNLSARALPPADCSR